MIFTEPLEDTEKITLQEMNKNNPSPHVRMRAHAVLLSNKGFEVKEIVKTDCLRFGCICSLQYRFVIIENIDRCGNQLRGDLGLGSNMQAKTL